MWQVSLEQRRGAGESLPPPSRMLDCRERPGSGISLRNTPIAHQRNASYDDRHASIIRRIRRGPRQICALRPAGASVAHAA